jgi:hypothetical protein
LVRSDNEGKHENHQRHAGTQSSARKAAG